MGKPSNSMGDKIGLTGFGGRKQINTIQMSVKQNRDQIIMASKKSQNYMNLSTKLSDAPEKKEIILNKPNRR